MVTFGVVASACALLFFGGLSFARAVQSPSARAPSISESGCNGYDELCDKRVDEVTFAGTHNAMSASGVPGTFFARQSGAIIAQVGEGARAVLVDLYYGLERDGVVRTDVYAETEASERLSDEESAVLHNAFGQLGMAIPESERDLFLCHLWCEAGAMRAVDTFRQIDSWLRENPNEVVLIVIEDHVDPADAVQALQRSGLSKRAYNWEPGTPLPTLREMIEQRRNVLIMAEREGSDTTPWYHAAYDTLLQDTEWNFESIRDFSCGLKRGDPERPLLLVNHWLTAGDPTAAERANGAAVLRRRAEACRSERDMRPNIIAVDFFERGDLKAIVAELNEVGPPRSILQAGAER
jgi:hypothetical protein